MYTNKCIHLSLDLGSQYFVSVGLLIRVQCHFSLINHIHNRSSSVSSFILCAVKTQRPLYVYGCFSSFTVVLPTSNLTILFKHLSFSECFQSLSLFLNKFHLVYIRVSSLCSIFYRSDKHTASPLHHYSIIVLLSGKSSVLHLAILPPTPQAITDALSSPQFCRFPECHRVGIIPLMDSMQPFQTGFFLLHIFHICILVVYTILS